MPAPVTGILGSFQYIDAATEAIRALHGQGRRNLTVYSATPNHELEEALHLKISPVRLFTLIGGITGCLGGLAMTYWMSLDWPLLVGGKPIATVPPYVVIMFELTVLCGACPRWRGWSFSRSSSTAAASSSIPHSPMTGSGCSSPAASRSIPRWRSCCAMPA